MTRFTTTHHMDVYRRSVKWQRETPTTKRTHSRYKCCHTSCGRLNILTTYHHQFCWMIAKLWKKYWDIPRVKCSV